MKNLGVSVTASILYVVFLLCIDSKFAAEFKRYLIED